MYQNTASIYLDVFIESYWEPLTSSTEYEVFRFIILVKSNLHPPNT